MSNDFKNFLWGLLIAATISASFFYIGRSVGYGDGFRACNETYGPIPDTYRAVVFIRTPVDTTWRPVWDYRAEKFDEAAQALDVFQEWFTPALKNESDIKASVDYTNY